MDITSDRQTGDAAVAEHEWQWSPKDGGGGRGPVAGAALLDKAFAILDLVSVAAPRAMSGGDLQRRTGWPRATVYRILSALSAAGYLRFDPIEHGYALGFRFMELAQNVWAAPTLASVAALELRRLRDITGETIYLAALQDGAMVSVCKFESAHEHRSAASLGVRKPIHSTSQGKAFLAHLPEEEVDRFLRQEPLEAFTPTTETDPDRLKAQLALVRLRGYATEVEETLLGVRCVAAAILDDTGKPLATISVAGPTYRLTHERAMQLGPEVASVARDIAAALPASEPPASVGSGGPQILAEAPAPAFHGMTPLWHRGVSGLFWGDRFAPSVYLTTHRTEMVGRGAAGPLDAMMLTPNGAVAFHDGSLVFFRQGLDARVAHGVAMPKITAARVDAEGRAWAACQVAEDGRSQVGLLAANGGFEPVWTVSAPIRALAWDHDHRLLYASAPNQSVIYLMDAAGRPPRVFTRIPAGSGRPNGIAVDRRGRLWVTLYDGWSIAALTSYGEFDTTIALPVPRPTGLTFGGPSLTRLYVASAKFGLTRDAVENAPLSGRVFAIDMAEPGYPEMPVGWTI